MIESIVQVVGNTPLIRLGKLSSGNVFAALNLDNGRNRVVTVLPDRAERYFSTALL